MSRGKTSTNPGPISRYLSAELKPIVRARTETQEEIAIAAAISTGQLADLLNAKKEFTVGQLDRLCYVLDLKASVIMRKAEKDLKERYVDGMTVSLELIR